MSAMTLISSTELKEADFSDVTEWCICRKDNPSISLCGGILEGVGIPDAEVPDEITCADCRRVMEEESK